MTFPSVLSGDARWTIAAGDCLRILPTLPDESIDAIVTDPPYGISYKPKRHRAIANDERPFIWWLHEAYRVAKDGSALVCFCRWDVQEAFRFAMELAGFRVRAQLVWDRDAHGMGDTLGAPAPAHDVMWFATKGRFKFPRGRLSSVIRARRLRGAALTHPTEKPHDLMARLVRAVCPEGGVVLDPFTGSGSTGAAALSVGCRFVGIELDDGYVDAARARLAA